MSWNTVLTFAEARPEQVAAALPPDVQGQSGQTTFEEATSMFSEGVALLDAGTWTVLCSNQVLSMGEGGLLDPGIDLELGQQAFPGTDFMARASATGRVLTLMLAGTGDIYGFWLWENGQQRRHLMTSASKIVEESGDPLPEETMTTPGDYDEDWLFGLMETVTGLRLDRLIDLRAEVYAAGVKTA